MRGLSLVAASGGHSSSRCAGLSLSRPLSLRSTGYRRAGSVIVAHGPSCSAARGIFPDQGSNPCPLHWQADSQPLRHQGSPAFAFLTCSPMTLTLLVQGPHFGNHCTSEKTTALEQEDLGLRHPSGFYNFCNLGEKMLVLPRLEFSAL